MLKTVKLKEPLIVTEVVVDIQDCKGDNETAPNLTITLVKWNKEDVEQQLQAHINENQQEIMEE